MSYQEIVLAAWLHDIGKFAQRAGIEGSGGHQNYTEKFLQSVKDCLPDGIDAEKVIGLASKHHNPSEYDEWIIAHGDRISNGAEKCSDNKNNDDETMYQTPLVHLISSLHIKEKQKPTIAYSPLEQMESKTVFPSNNAKTNKNDYLELWKKFERDFRTLRGLKYDEFIRSLDTLMERYCWCIPSSTVQEYADISLYQHSKLAAAFAGTLYLYHKEKNTETESALNVKDEKCFLFIQGDMSGIQNYIFDITTPDSSAKLLRARSFQVWALSEIIAEYLAGSFGVSTENIITSSGGKFLLLAPNTPAVSQKLKDLRYEIEKHFLEEFAGKIAFVLSDGIPASSSDLQKGKTQELINEIGWQGEKAKQKKMQAVLGKHGYVLEDLYAGLHEYGECDYCGTLPAVIKLEEEKKKICENCDELITIGGKLLKANKKANKIILKTEELSSFHEMILIPEKGDKEYEEFGYMTEYKPGCPLISLPYAAPFKNENVLCTFQDIADKAKGDKKLAMFKADIDNLGLIFTSSFGDRISFSRYAQLSRHLHYFFSGFIADFISDNPDHPEYGKNIYTVFSGGDDLCIIGAWDTIMRFAADFRKNFSAFTNNNPSVTLSGGIAMFSPRLPVRSAAAMAEEALEKAKDRKEKKDEKKIVKNGISVFGVTVSWDEYEESLKDAKKIVQYMDDKQVSSAVVYKMIDFANRAQMVRNGSLRDMVWMSNYRYTVARNIKPEYKDALEFFHKFSVCPEVMEKSRIAVSYALYRNRKGKEE